MSNITKRLQRLTALDDDGFSELHRLARFDKYFDDLIEKVTPLKADELEIALSTKAASGYKQTPLHLAFRFPNSIAISELLGPLNGSQKINVLSIEDSAGHTPLHSLIFDAIDGNPMHHGLILCVFSGMTQAEIDQLISKPNSKGRTLKELLEKQTPELLPYTKQNVSQAEFINTLPSGLRHLLG